MDIKSSMLQRASLVLVEFFLAKICENVNIPGYIDTYTILFLILH